MHKHDAGDGGWHGSSIDVRNKPHTMATDTEDAVERGKEEGRATREKDKSKVFGLKTQRFSVADVSMVVDIRKITKFCHN
jgi:hypothetical protein